MSRPAGGPHGAVAFSSRHGWLRRNALSPHRVRLSGAPGAPHWTGCSSANRALAGKLLWDGIVAVPEVFDTGCSALFLDGERGQPSASARSGDAGERHRRPGALRLISQTCGHIATHGGTQALRKLWVFGGCPSSANQLWPRGGPLYRVDGPSGFTQAVENHGRTISERHIRTPQRRVHRV
jgi:hypothetical protein